MLEIFGQDPEGAANNMLESFGKKHTMKEQVEMKRLYSRHQGEIIYVHRQKKTPLKLVVLTLIDLREQHKFVLAKALGQATDNNFKLPLTTACRGRVQKKKIYV